MARRFVAIWFRHLITDWLAIRQPGLLSIPFVVAAPQRGRMVIQSANGLAQAQGIYTGMVVADARALVPLLQVIDAQPGHAAALLKKIATWCIRYTPVAAVDLPNGIILDVSGCAHLWGGERNYLQEIITRLKNTGYDVRVAMADTIGAAWAIARYGKIRAIVEASGQADALMPLPPVALRLEPAILERLHKLGFHQVGHFISMPRIVLRRRFGESLLLRLDQALGAVEEVIDPVILPVPYQERMPCPEPISTATGIEIALTHLLKLLCSRLQQEEKGLRNASFKGYRVDGRVEEITIGTNRPVHQPAHLFKLFEPRLASIEPALGIELFTLESSKTESFPAGQQQLWTGACGLKDNGLAELLDRVANRLGAHTIHRYLPAEHYWPERSIITVADMRVLPATPWQTDRPRPCRLLSVPELVEVTAPVPDYPPMLFRYKGKLHTVKKADGPERIEREWWIEEGEHRDYYCVEDEEGQRYWLFRLGHYSTAQLPKWYMHGFFA
jgi:protein ImuB